MFYNEFIDEFKLDFNPPTYIFTKFDSDKDWHFDWEEFYRNNIHRLNINEIFEKLIQENKAYINKFFSNNFLEKYSNIEYYYQENENDNVVRTYFSLAELLWSKSRYSNKLYNYSNYIKLTDLQKIKLIPYLDDLEKKFIKSIINENFSESVNKEILKYLNYNLSENALLILYCRNDNIYLPIVNLSVNDKLLQYALIYGSINVVKLLDERLLLENHNNPFELTCINSTNESDKMFNSRDSKDSRDSKNDKNRSIYECAKICKKYFEIKYHLFDKWISICGSEDDYAPEIQDVIPLFVNKEKIRTKTGIIELTQKFGEHIVWNILRLQNSEILTILLSD
jgi:hypothetical protein